MILKIMPGYRILPLGDTALTLEFGDRIDPALQAAVSALDQAIADARAQGHLHGIVETMPTFRSLTVIFDPLETDHDRITELLNTLPGSSLEQPLQGRHWLLPACYEPGFAPDLDSVAHTIDGDTKTVVRLHSGREYVVYMLGFLPGFPFMGDLPEPLRLPRRTEPRTRVPAGSVAIATGLTAIYPWESPGGWHLLGRCPVPLFDASQKVPALLQAGDRVRFEPVSAAEYARIERALAAGELDPGAFRMDHEAGSA